MPEVTFLLPVYNSARYLKRALDSLFVQTLQSFDVVAVDDGSTDQSLKILRRFAEREGRLRIMSRPNTGIVGALNDGLEKCHGEYVARMDADDWCHPKRLELQMAYMKSHSDCVALGTAAMFTDAEGRFLKIYRPPSEHSDITDGLCNGNGGSLIHGACLFRRTALERVGRYRPHYNRIEDLDLFIRLEAEGRLVNLPEVLYFYRQHLSSTNHNRPLRDDRYASATLHIRRKYGLPELPPPALRATFAAAATHDHSEVRRLWALDAVEGGHLYGAWANMLKAVAKNPLRRRNVATLRYLIHVTLRRTKRCQSQE